MTEAEGELKKRIGKLGSIELDYIDTAMCEVFAILNEAKQEFPSRFFKGQLLDVEELQVWQWFLKWFGEAEK